MKVHRIYKMVFRFLKWICPSHLFEEIEGDLIQRFNRDANTFGERKAMKKLMWNGLRFLRPGILLRNKFSADYFQLYMIRTNVVLAGRGMFRNKVFSTINIGGLSVSMAACVLILYYVRFELSYDGFHRNAENIYRVATKVTLQNEVINHETNTYVGIRRAVMDQFSDVKASTSIGGFNSDNVFMWYEDPKGGFSPVQSYKAFGVDSSFLQVFSFSLIEGDVNSVLREANSAVVSQSFAARYFGGNAVGRILETFDGVDREKFTITGVLEDIPANSHLKFDVATRGPSTPRNFLNRDAGFWDWGGLTYVVIQNESDVFALEQKLNSLAVAKNGLKTNKDDYGQVSTFELQPLKKIHLHSHLLYETETNGSGILVNAMIILASMIIVIAWINYVNLATAVSEHRSRSIGVRKIIGASRPGLIHQVLTECVLFNLISLFIAIALVAVVLPDFARFAGIPTDYSLLFNKWTFVSLAGFGVMSSMMSGIYPSWFISSFSSVQALKGQSTTGKSFFVRKALVVFQFAAAVILMAGALVSISQLTFMRSKELGIDINRIVVVKAMNFDKEAWSDSAGGFVVDSAYMTKVDAFKNDLRMKSTLASVTTLSHLPGEVPSWGTEFKAPSIDNEKAFRLLAVGIDYDFINTLNVKLLAGRNFSIDVPTDKGNEGRRAVLLNEAASRLLGLSHRKPRSTVISIRTGARIMK